MWKRIRADIVDMGYNRKSNCDVDLTVDAMEYSGPNTEFYIFTGDGDFEYLIRKVVSKGSVVHIVSSAKKKIKTSQNIILQDFQQN